MVGRPLGLLAALVLACGGLVGLRRGAVREAPRRRLRTLGMRKSGKSSIWKLGTEKPGGIILWSYGRSATDTFAGSVMLSSKWSYCLHEKEGFKNHRLTAAALTGCISRNQRVTHVKPWHIMAKEAGFNTVAVEFRFNQLARDISSFELWAVGHGSQSKDARAAQQFCKKGLLEEWKEEYIFWKKGVTQAKMQQLSVVELTFEDVTSKLCPAVMRTLALAGVKMPNCIVFQSPHTKTSNHGASVQDRIGKEAHQCLVERFKAQPTFQWMLEDESRREVPPTGWDPSRWNI